MEFNSFAEFLAMGRHGLYVWLSYGITAVIVVINVILPMMQRRRFLKEQRQRMRRERRNQTGEKQHASST
ncbi:MAG: heme exporter protein CcmD [Oceanospirillaceae bacterium]|nr:heme exporter protein CcmD [Oceanospirillaceae bacterium]